MTKGIGGVGDANPKMNCLPPAPEGASSVLVKFIAPQLRISALRAVSFTTADAVVSSRFGCMYGNISSRFTISAARRTAVRAYREDGDDAVPIGLTTAGTVAACAARLLPDSDGAIVTLELGLMSLDVAVFPPLAAAAATAGAEVSVSAITGCE